MRRSILLGLLVLGTFACDKHPSGGGVSQALPSRASNSPGDFPDNPMLAHIPADTPYAFASFKPIPAEYLGWVKDRFGPIWSLALASYAQGRGDDAQARAVIEQLRNTSLADLGFTAKSRWAVYGIDQYPVARVELDGDRLFAFAQQLGRHFDDPLPAPTERAGYKTWLRDVGPGWGLLVAVGKTELVVAAAPRAKLDASAALILGETNPAKALTTADMKAIAARDGYTGQGVAFVDVARVVGLIADANGAGPACRDAILALAKRVPRVTLGYDDLNAKAVGFGMVVELAPDVLAEARASSGSLAGVPRMLASKPMMGLAFTANIEQSRAMLAHAARAVRVVAEQCPGSGLDDTVNGIEQAATVPLPPFITGLHGGVIAVQSVALSPRGTPSRIDGYAVGQLDHADQVIKLLTQKLPGFELAADGTPRALPQMIPFAGHAAATSDAIAVALGKDSERVVVDVLHDKPQPAPLAAIVIDYGKLGDYVLPMMQGPQQELDRVMFAALGVATLQILNDERGLVLWGRMTLR